MVPPNSILTGNETGAEALAKLDALFAPPDSNYSPAVAKKPKKRTAPAKPKPRQKAPQRAPRDMFAGMTHQQKLAALYGSGNGPRLSSVQYVSGPATTPYKAFSWMGVTRDPYEFRFGNGGRVSRSFARHVKDGVRGRRAGLAMRPASAPKGSAPTRAAGKPGKPNKIVPSGANGVAGHNLEPGYTFKPAGKE